MRERDKRHWTCLNRNRIRSIDRWQCLLVDIFLIGMSKVDDLRNRLVVWPMSCFRIDFNVKTLTINPKRTLIEEIDQILIDHSHERTDFFVFSFLSRVTLTFVNWRMRGLSAPVRRPISLSRVNSVDGDDLNEQGNIHSSKINNRFIPIRTRLIELNISLKFPFFSLFKIDETRLFALLRIVVSSLSISLSLPLFVPLWSSFVDLRWVWRMRNSQLWDQYAITLGTSGKTRSLNEKCSCVESFQST